MPTPIESLGLFVAAELPKRPYTNTFPFAAGKTLITTGVGLEVVAGDAPGEYLDNTFRIKDNDDTTKKIAFQASGIATGEERTITMPDADVDLGKVPTGVTPTYATGRLMVPLADGTSIPLSAFGGTRLANLNSPATVLTANGHYLFYSNTGSYYTVICALVLPTAPDDMTYVRISNISSLDSFAVDAGATVAPGGTDKINGVAATFSITDYLVNYRNAVITFTYSAFSENWTVSVLGDLINPSTIAIYDADKTNSTTLTPVANLTDNRVITLPNADVDLGAVTTSVLATGGAWTYTTGMGSVVITATTGSNSFNVVDLGSNLMHSVTIRHGDFTSQYNDDPITFILTTETTSCTFYDETGTIILGTAISGTPLSVTIRPGESWEIRALASTDTFSVVRSFYPLLPIPNLKLRNSTTSALGYTLAGTVITTDKVITLPNADVNLGDLPFVATTNSNALGRTTARILNGSSNTANGTLGVILTGIGITTNLGGAVVQGAYQTVYANQAAVKQSVMIVGQTTANVLTELTNCGTGGVITAAGDTIYILATKPNGMSNTNGVGIHRITLTGSNQTTGATYFGFSGEYIVTCSYNGTTTVIDAITTVHTSLRAGVAETFTPSFTLDVTTANAALLIGVTTTLGNVRCAGHVESVYS